MKYAWLRRSLIVAATLFAFAACQKEFSIDGANGNNNNTVDLATKVTAAVVSGFVADENNNPVSGASVKVGMQTFITDEYGFFEAKNIEVSKNAATVTVSRSGYFPGIRTFMAVANKNAFVRIKLLPKTNSGTISAANGGSATLSNGLKITLPANAVVNATSGAAYTGTINVAAQWLNPVAADLPQIMPGDLRAIDADNNMQLLTTYGMAAVELTDAGGNKLQIATDKKAKLTMPLPASIAGKAPATIALWHFDEAKGLWIEEGSAVKTGNVYEGEVSHFSFWNCDVPNNYVQMDITLHDAANKPMAYTYVVVKNVATEQWATGITDSTGYVKGAVPANSQLIVEVHSNLFCGNAAYSQTINTTNNNISLGTVNVSDNPNNFTTISGTVTNCSNAPVSNGAIIIKKDGYYSRHTLSATGSYNLTMILCNGTPSSIDVIAEDYSSSQQSSITTHTINSGNNNLGTLQACGMSATQFINFTINGTAYSFTAPADSLAYNNNNQNEATARGRQITGTGTFKDVFVSFSNSGLAVGSQQPVSLFSSNIITEPYNIVAGSKVTITEYGSIGEFVGGNATITANGTNPPNTPYTINFSFRIRRYN